MVDIISEHAPVSFRQRDDQGVATLGRRVRRTISKIAPDNCERIAAQLAALDISTVEEMESVAMIIVGKALQEPAFHHCYPIVIRHMAVQSAARVQPGQDAKCFTELVMGACQYVFEQHLRAALNDDSGCASGYVPLARPTRPEGVLRPEGLSFECTNDHDRKEKQRRALIASVRLVAVLFLNGVASVRLIDHVVRCLVKQRVYGVETKGFSDPPAPNGQDADREKARSTQMVPELILLGGDPCRIHVDPNEDVYTLQARLEEELDVAQDSLQLVDAAGGVAPHTARVSDLDSPVLQIVLLPRPQSPLTVECLCGLLVTLSEETATSNANAARFAPLTAPLSPPQTTPLGDLRACRGAWVGVVTECANHLSKIRDDECSQCLFGTERERPTLGKRIMFQIGDTLTRTNAWLRSVNAAA